MTLLAACPLRRRGFAGLKNGATLDFPLPAELGPRLRRYLEVHRAILANCGTPTAGLWLNTRGAPLSAAGLGQRVARVTARHLGRPIPVHLFRHAAATSLATEDPHHVRLVAALLGHPRLATGERYMPCLRCFPIGSATKTARLFLALHRR